MKSRTLMFKLNIFLLWVRKSAYWAPILPRECFITWYFNAIASYCISRFRLIKNLKLAISLLAARQFRQIWWFCEQDDRKHIRLIFLKILTLHFSLLWCQCHIILVFHFLGRIHCLFLLFFDIINSSSIAYIFWWIILYNLQGDWVSE